MTPSLKPVAEQVIVVMGASSGIGLATARAAAAAGARVVLAARNRDALAQAADGIGAAGGTASWIAADVGDADQVRAVVDHAIARFGRIDSWIHVAGVAVYAELEALPDEEHRALFRTNYFGVVHAAKAALPALKASGGALVVVGSIASDMPSPVLGAYAASKHAVKGYVGSLRMELLRQEAPVQVVLVKPSGIDTPIGRNAANHGAEGHHGEAQIPPPHYDPALVAEVLLHACTQSARELTVGGAGWAQTMFGAHFPRLFDRLGGLVVPALFDPAKRPPPGSALDAPKEGGAERAHDDGRRTSLFTAAELHPKATAAALLALAGGLALVATRRVRRAR